MWLTPRRLSSSYRDPASTYTPTPEKGPGSDSLATRMPFESVVIWLSSTGSYDVVNKEKKEKKTQSSRNRVICSRGITYLGYRLASSRKTSGYGPLTPNKRLNGLNRPER